MIARIIYPRPTCCISVTISCSMDPVVYLLSSSKDVDGIKAYRFSNSLVVDSDVSYSVVNRVDLLFQPI